MYQTKMLCCCGLGDSYSSKIVFVVEEGQALPLQLPGDEAGHILAMGSCPPESEGQAEVGEVSALELKTN